MVRSVGAGKKIAVGFDVCFSLGVFVLLRFNCIASSDRESFNLFTYSFVHVTLTEDTVVAILKACWLIGRTTWWSEKFLAQVRKKDGSDYEPDSLRVISASLLGSRQQCCYCQAKKVY